MKQDNWNQKINLFETKMNVLLCFEVCLHVLSYPRKKTLAILPIYPTLHPCVIFNVLSLLFPPVPSVAVVHQFHCLCAHLCPYPFAVMLVTPKILKEILKIFTYHVL